MQMESVWQFPNQNLKQHGESVYSHTKQLILGDFTDFKLPEWFIQNHHFIINNLHSWNVIKTYNELHDIGKPKCLTIDELGRKHFFNHAQVSKEVFLACFSDKLIEAELIGLDMLLHTSNWEAIEALNLDIKTLCTLLITAFSEIHSNAKAANQENNLNPLDTISFKIKYKKLDRIGKRIVEKIKKHADTYLYIIVRKDIKNSTHIAVQCAHAIFEQERVQHPSIIILEVADENELKAAMRDLLEKDVQFSIFREPMPDYNNSITAIATEPLDLERKKLLADYKLLKI